MKLPINYEQADWRQRRKAREEYVLVQSGRCYYCGDDLKESPPAAITSRKIKWFLFPPNFLKHPIHLQHNHNTGMTEGAVHAYCNAVMWQYEGR